jgi:nucleotide-binding universal stress UspA family protein
MKKFNKILFPIDFSDVSSEIVPYVISLADRLNDEVHIIFVVRRLENCRSIF